MGDVVGDLNRRRGNVGGRVSSEAMRAGKIVNADGAAGRICSATCHSFALNATPGSRAPIHDGLSPDYEQAALEERSQRT